MRCGPTPRHMRGLRVSLDFSSIWSGIGVLLICFDLGSPLCSVYAPESPKMDGRRRRLGGRAAPSPGVDILVSAPVKANEGDRSRLDSGLGSGLKNDRPIGFGQSARDDGDAKTRAVSADSSHATRGERQITTLVRPWNLSQERLCAPPPLSTSFSIFPLLLVFRSIPPS